MTKAKVTINVCGIKVKEYETEYGFPDIAGFLKEMRELGIKTKCSVSIQEKPIQEYIPAGVYGKV